DGVAERCEATAHLALHGDRRQQEVEILRADPPAQRSERLVERSPHALLGEGAAELLARRRLALLGDRLQSELEAVAGTKGRREGDEKVGELLLECRPAARGTDAQRDDRRVAADAAEDESGNDTAEGAADQRTEDRSAADQIEKLGGSERRVGALDQPLHAAPDRELAEVALG